MEYIKPKQFLRQPKEVQQVFVDYWKPEMHDLFFRNFTNSNGYLKGTYVGWIGDNETLNNAIKDKSFLPIFTEEKLRKFIEEKTGFSIIAIRLNCYGYEINIGNAYISKPKDNNLLQSYWKTACEIARTNNKRSD